MDVKTNHCLFSTPKKPSLTAVCVCVCVCVCVYAAQSRSVSVWLSTRNSDHTTHKHSASSAQPP